MSLVIYPFDVMLSFGETDEVLIKKLDSYGIDHAEHPWKLESDKVLGRTVAFDSGQTLIRMPKMPTTCEDYGTLQHEIFHAVEFLFKRINVTHTTDCGEVYAYLIGYLTTEIYKKIS